MIISLLNRQTFDEPLDLLKLFLLLTFFVWFVFCFCFLCLFFVFWESGTLDKNEIKETLKNLHLGVSDHDIMHWMRSLDDDGSGAVDPPEFFYHRGARLERVLLRLTRNLLGYAASPAPDLVVDKLDVFLALMAWRACAGVHSLGCSILICIFSSPRPLFL